MTDSPVDSTTTKPANADELGTNVSRGRGTLEIAVGSAAVAIAGVVWVFAGRAAPAPVINSAPQPERVIIAHEAGIDVTGGGPQKVSKRLEAVFAEGRTTPFEALRFSSGMYLVDENNGVFTGYASIANEDGSPSLICSVVEGRLEGPAINYHPDGSIKLARTFREGKPAGQILEFFETGDMKLRAMAGADSPNGGTLVSEVIAGYYDRYGAYQRRNLKTGRLQFIFENGTTNFTNDSMALEQQTGYMLFYDTMLGQDVYTTDSRKINSLNNG